jgi:four helix bundle protein
MEKEGNNKIYNLEERTTVFAQRVIKLCRALPKDPINQRLTGQVTGSAGSVGANYREANDALGKKDFIHRLRIARKEAKETIHWLALIETANPNISPRMKGLKIEAEEIKNIISSIIIKTENKNKKN